MKKQITNLFMKSHQETVYDLPAYNSDATFAWIKNHSGLPYLVLNINIPHSMIFNEINNINRLLVDHRDGDYEHTGWKSFCLHGKSFDATREDSYYQDDRAYHWTKEALALMPNTVKYFQNQWPGSEYARVRVMLLEPGGHVALHHDQNHSELGPINIAITNPPNCNFAIEKVGYVPFIPGSAIWLDISRLHAVQNCSNQNRWHIIVHQNTDHPKFQQMVVNSYHRLYNNTNEKSRNYSS